MSLKQCVIAGKKWDVHFSNDTGRDIDIEMAEMYRSPKGTEGGLTMAILDAISAHFGTVEIHINEVSESGCETCDYGSLYGLRIYVRGCTKGLDQKIAAIEGAS